MDRESSTHRERWARAAAGFDPEYQRELNEFADWEEELDHADYYGWYLDYKLGK